MNKSSHLLIGRLLCRGLEDRYGIYLDQGGFLLGSILPDLRPSFLYRTHVLRKCSDQVVRRIGEMLRSTKQTSAYFGRGFSIKLGILCHYYADFLCFAHSSAFRGDLVSHVKYEKELYYYLKGRFSDGQGDNSVRIPLGEISPGDIFSRFLSRLDSHAAMAPSFENDAVQALRACTEALVLLTGAAMMVEPPETCQPMPSNA